MNSEIISVTARQVFTRRPNMGVEATVITTGGAGRAVCTAGVSVGAHEVAFKYDYGAKWGGKGVEGAVRSINEIISPKLRGLDSSSQRGIDEAILNICEDAKTALGGNAVAAVSAAALKAGADSLRIPLYRHIGGEFAATLPVPSMPAFGGSTRYGGGVSNPGIKPSYGFVCYGFASFYEASAAAWDISVVWKAELRKRGLHFPESPGSFGIIPQGVFKDEREIWDLMAHTIRAAGYENRVGLQVDAAADSYYMKEQGKYRGLFTGKELGPDELLDMFVKMTEDHPFVIIEDPFEENDYAHHAWLTEEVDIQIVGDDLFTTNAGRLRKGAETGACNAVLLKVNQIGTITEALEMVHAAKQEGYQVMPCDSRGEGEAIADYCVGINAGCVRECALGSDANRFLEIESELGASAIFLGSRGLSGRRFHAKIDY